MAGIFKAYDIRGVYPDELAHEVVQKLGSSFGALKCGTTVVGCDARKSSPVLKELFIKGLHSAGSSVVDIGSVTTPMAIFATAYYGFHAGAIITASHNPPQYNGVKLYDKGGVPLSYEPTIREMEELYQFA